MSQQWFEFQSSSSAKFNENHTHYGLTMLPAFIIICISVELWPALNSQLYFESTCLEAPKPAFFQARISLMLTPLYSQWKYFRWQWSRRLRNQPGKFLIWNCFLYLRSLTWLFIEKPLYEYFSLMDLKDYVVKKSLISTEKEKKMQEKDRRLSFLFLPPVFSPAKLIFHFPHSSFT